MLFTDSPLGEMSPKNGTYPSGFDRPPWSLSARGFEVTRVRVGFHMLRPATPETAGTRNSRHCRGTWSIAGQTARWCVHPRRWPLSSYVSLGAACHQGEGKTAARAAPCVAGVWLYPRRQPPWTPAGARRAKLRSRRAARDRRPKGVVRQSLTPSWHAKPRTGSSVPCPELRQAADGRPPSARATSGGCAWSGGVRAWECCTPGEVTVTTAIKDTAPPTQFTALKVPLALPPRRAPWGTRLSRDPHAFLILLCSRS